ncbi:hypothetical protein Acr_06g0011900 [Actinidia rufa]|uniref:NB-ARC domain-containing disease resistance protein n=1 Tax=Actinidia rufa TaxID=165716 RepID=A0A7J0ESE2_9ERIC|nr:hypothetical protein Acr_06g0011900 [Actinidia rufa]
MAAKQVGDRSSRDSSRAHTPTGEEETIVGFEEELTMIKEQLTGVPKQLDVISIVGMPGIEVDQMSVEKLAQRLYQRLKGRRYFIVMDDIWDRRVWFDLKTCFPNDNNGSRIMFTSRNEDVTLLAKSSRPPLSLRFLTDDESWVLFQQKVFPRETCPPQLTEIGKHIANKCQGVPLVIVVVAGILTNEKKSPDQWEKVGKTLNSQMTADPQIWLNTLALSYNHLPHHLKPCFLYFGLFPEDYQVPVWKLIWLWMAEGFIRETGEKSLEDVAEEYLMELIGRSLVLVSSRRYDGGVKACGIHDLVRDFCIKQAEKECFMQQNFCELPVSYFSQPKDLFIEDSGSTLITPRFGFATQSGCTKSELADLDYLRSLIRLGGVRFPTNLKKLTLTESEAEWNEIATLGKSLPNLEALQLLTFACVGKCWKTSDGDFPQLRFLKLFAVPIEEWQVSSNPFPRLQRLVLVGCPELQGIPSEIGEVPTLQMIEVRDCNTSVANSAHKIKEEQVSMGNNWLQNVESGNLESPKQSV